jgi:hypothetical protein
MSTPSHRFFVGLAIVALNLVACSSSTLLKKTSDAAAAPDLEIADLAIRDVVADLAGPDLAGPDLTGPDLARAEVHSPDTLLAGKDAIVFADLPAGKDTIPVDLPATVADALASDVPTPDDPPTDGVPRDGQADGAPTCKSDASGPVPCNDDPNSEAVMGTCQSDGTCACNSYFVLNPSTGRCMYPPRDASVRSDVSAAAGCTGDYTACGCGCCGGVQAPPSCYYPSLGETITVITAQDEVEKSSTNCSFEGCSLGIHYICCAEPAPESPSSAAYTAEGYSGGLDHVMISKVGDDCATVSFARPLTGSNSALKITMPSSWGVVSAGFGSCGDGGITDQAKGAVGTFALRVSGSQCVADLHATLFAFVTDGTVKTTRLDIDGVTVTGLPGGLCD